MFLSRITFWVLSALTSMKTNTSLPYLGRLSPERQAILFKLKAFQDRFVLAGGTAIMLQMGHRESYDFDCFCQDPLPQTLFVKAKRVFGKQTRLILKNFELLFVMTPEGIEINFVSYPFMPIKPPLSSPTLRLFHLDDLAANKAITLGRRPQWRDYVDLFFLMKWKLYTPASIIALTEKKFGGEFNDKLFLKQLTYFNDVEVRPTVFLKKSHTDKEIKTFLRQEVKNHFRTLRP